QERLSQVAAMINDICHGKTAVGVRQKSQEVHDFLAQEVMELAAEVMHESDENGSLAIHWYGFSELLPRFEEGSGAQQALRILDEKTLIDELLKETIAADADDVRVLVGGEGREEFSELSIVIGRYGTRNMAGAISVLGPIRMRYGRAISTVRYVSNLMTAMI
ncbi:MAG TPA: HrcA family transcriptional regulator, partial [Aggregatilineales bacterium]|nr:HrcA family transcriptional regulator [Aggregatilineales bacterium]